MALSTQRAVSDGTLVTLDLSIKYMKRADIGVFLADLPAPEGSWAWVGATDKRIRFTDPVPNGVEVLIKRTTKIDANQHIYVLGAKFNNVSMDENFTQLLYLTQEAVEGAALTDIFNDVDFHGYKIKNLGVAVDRNDAVSFGQLQDMVPGVWTAKQQAEAARDKAKEWAVKPTAVEGTSQSAQTNAERAQGSATSSATASAASIAARDKSLSHANVSANWAVAANASREAAATSEALAKNWANLPRNQEVTPGEYSALHWSRISQSWADAAASGVLPDNSITLQKLTPEVRDQTWLKLTGGTVGGAGVTLAESSTPGWSAPMDFRGASGVQTRLRASPTSFEVRVGGTASGDTAIRVNYDRSVQFLGAAAGPSFDVLRPAQNSIRSGFVYWRHANTGSEGTELTSSMQAVGPYLETKVAGNLFARYQSGDLSANFYGPVRSAGKDLATKESVDGVLASVNDLGGRVSTLEAVKPVKTVNGTAPDAAGNVTVAVGPNLGFEAIGSFAMLMPTGSWGASMGPGTTRAGSQLMHTNASGNNVTRNPPGTWRLHGYLTSGSGNENTKVSIWQRIS